jgi:hypothetical protein
VRFLPKSFAFDCNNNVVLGECSVACYCDSSAAAIF